MDSLRNVITEVITSYIEQGGETPLCIQQDGGGLTALSIANTTRATYIEGFEAFRTEAIVAAPELAGILESIVPRCETLSEGMDKASEPWWPLTIEKALQSVPDSIQRIFLRTWVLKVLMLEDHAYKLCRLALRDIKDLAKDCPIDRRGAILQRVDTLEQSIVPEQIITPQHIDARTIE